MSSLLPIISAAGAAGGEPMYIDDLFSTYAYRGNSSTQTITNNIDLADEDGLVWIKSRSTKDNFLFDTVRGAGNYLRSNTNDGQATDTTILSSFSSSGFSVGSSNSSNESGIDFASWTFRKAPGFFDVVTWSGNGTAGREIAHNLGCVPGMIIVKSKQTGTSWRVWHKSAPTSVATLQTTNPFTTSSAEYYFGNNTSTVYPTSSVFTLGTDTDVNANGKTYVAYLFADGASADAQIFGTDSDQAVVKCGSFTTSSGNATINLGFEPQWLLVKQTGSSDDWRVIDNIRGFGVDGGWQFLRPNTYDGEYDNGGYAVAKLTSTGFITNGSYLYSSGTYAYVAIRRPHKPAESGTEVFAVDACNNPATVPAWQSGFPVDMFFNRRTSNTVGMFWFDRLRGSKYLYSPTTQAEATDAMQFDYMNGVASSGSLTDYYAWMFKRSPGFFDVVCYEGTGVAGLEINHNLGVVPEMIITKRRDSTSDWGVYHKDLNVNGDNAPETDAIYLNKYYPAEDRIYSWNDTAPTDTKFTLGTAGEVANNVSGSKGIAYLFASQAGISKVGGYTGNGSSQTIDCGFSSGARFVLIKRTDYTSYPNASNWNLFDTERGIVAGNDSRLELNTTDAEDTGDDGIDPDSSGFTVNYVADNLDDVNVSGASYIYLAIA